MTPMELATLATVRALVARAQESLGGVVDVEMRPRVAAAVAWSRRDLRAAEDLLRALVGPANGNGNGRNGR